MNHLIKNENGRVEEEQVLHPIEKWVEKNAKKIVILCIAYCVLFFITIIINGIIATYIFGPSLIIIALIGMTLNLIVFKSKVSSLRKFIFSQKMFNTCLGLLLIASSLYLGRGEIMDVPYYLNKEFATFTGSPAEIEVVRRSGRGSGSRTKFVLESGEVLTYMGIIEGLNAKDKYEINYLPNSKHIYDITNLTTGERWRHR